MLRLRVTALVIPFAMSVVPSLEAQRRSPAIGMWIGGEAGAVVGTQLGLVASAGAGLELARRARIGAEIASIRVATFSGDETIRTILLTASVSADSARRGSWRLGVGNLRHHEESTNVQRTSSGLAAMAGLAFVGRSRPVAFRISVDGIRQLGSAANDDQARSILLVRVGLLGRQR